MSELAELRLARELARQTQPPADRSGFQRLVGPLGPLAGLTATCFFAHVPPRGGGSSVRKLVERVVPRLLAQLNRATHPQRVKLRGRARGSVDWSGTFKARAAASHDETVFVCRQTWRLYDLPENRLLKHLLARLVQCHDRTPTEARCWCALPLADHVDPRASVGDELAVIAHRLRRLRKNAYLRDVELPAVITTEHERAARSARNPLYREMADFYDRFVQVVEQPEWDALRETVHDTSDVLPITLARTFSRLMDRAPSQRDGVLE